MPYRRASDDEGEDYRARRKTYPVLVQRLNGHTKWVVGAVSTAILAVAAWGIQSDHASIIKRIEAGEVERTELRSQLILVLRDRAVDAAESRQFREETQRTLAEIKIDVKEVKRRR